MRTTGRRKPATARSKLWIAALGLLGAVGFGAGGRAEGCVVVYCGVDEEWCRAATTAFQKESGIHADMTRRSAGERYARLRAEKDNPPGDIRFGGTGDPHPAAWTGRRRAVRHHPQIRLSRQS